MKKFFFFAVAALALAACSNDETVEVNQGDAISFRPMINNVTRSTDITATTLQTSGFKVYATEYNTTTVYFEETDFSWDGTASYTSANKYYWPSSGALDFYAYASNGSSTITHTAQSKVFEITPATAAADQSDFVFANTNNKSKGSSADNTTFYGKNGVPLNFRHALSKVTVKLKNSNTATTVTVKDVTLGYIDNKGTFTYTGSTTNTNTDNKDTENLKYSDWNTSGATKTTYTQTATTTSYTSATNATALPTPFILVPQTLVNVTAYSTASASSAFNGAYIKAEIKIQNTKNNAYIAGDADNYVTALWPLQAIAWNPGYHYIYTVDLAGGGYYETNHDDDSDLDPILENAEIKFVSVTVDDWDEANYTVGNMVYAKGGSYTAGIVKEAGQYTITITGLTASESISSVSATGGTVNPTSGTASADGSFSFNLTVPENTTGSAATVTVTVTGATSGTTTITLTQAAS